MANQVERSIGGLALLVFLVAPAWGQDFEKTYSLPLGGRISVANVSGDIEVSGYEGASVIVTAYKEGRDRDLVAVEDRSDGSSIDLRVRYPENCNCNASVRFVLRVPGSSAYRFDPLKTASGDIAITGVAGEIEAKSASGDLTLSRVAGRVSAASASGDVSVTESSGIVNARSASGDVKVEIARLEGEGSMTFSSASGDVSVEIPRGIDAEVEISTASGRLETDFPLTVDDRETGRRKKAVGRLGSGRYPLKITSASGDVILRAR